MSTSHLPLTAMRSAIFRDGEIQIGGQVMVRWRVTNSTKARVRSKVVIFF